MKAAMRPLPLPVVAMLVSMSRERLLAAIAAGRLRATEVSGQLMATPANLARFLTDLSRDLSTRPDLDTRALPHIARQGFGSSLAGFRLVCARAPPPCERA